MGILDNVLVNIMYCIFLDSCKEFIRELGINYLYYNLY